MYSNSFNKLDYSKKESFSEKKGLTWLSLLNVIKVYINFG